MPSDTFTLQIFDAGISIPALHASTHLTGGTDAIPVATSSAAGLMSATQAAAVIANTAKVSNATHTGEVTGSGALTIANNAVTAAKIASSAVTADKIAADAVTTTKIVNGAVSLTKIADVTGPVVLGRSSSDSGSVSAVSCTPLGFSLISGVDQAAMRATLGLGVATTSTQGLMSSAQVVALNANTAKVSNATHTGEVTGATTLTIANNAVTAAKIASSAVTADKIAADAVTTNKLADSNVTLAKVQSIGEFTVLGRSASGTGSVTAVSCTALGFSLISGVDQAAMRTTLGLSFPLSVGNGGTNLSSYDVGDILYASGGTTLSKLPDVVTGNVLLSGGVTTAPAYGKVALSGAVTHVSGILPVANGGTGLATITGYVKGAGTTALSASPTIPVADISGVLPIANGGTGPSAFGQLSGQIEGDETIFPTSYNALALETTFSDLSSLFSGAGVDNLLRYTGTVTRKFLIFGSVDILSSTNGAQFSIKLALNGDLIDETQCNASVSVKSTGSGIAKLVTNWVVSLSTNDDIQLFVAGVGSADADRTGIPQRMRLVATPVY